MKYFQLPRIVFEYKKVNQKQLEFLTNSWTAHQKSECCLQLVNRT